MNRLRLILPSRINAFGNRLRSDVPVFVAAG
jgi:hypothetical protein